MAGTIRSALVALRDAGAVVEHVSSAYRTAPREDVNQEHFVNAAAQVDSADEPRRLLARALAIEAALGRVRSRRFGPRTIDIDLLMWSGGDYRDDRLEIPHPRLRGRRFALVPLAEIAPELRLTDGTTVAAAAEALAQDPDQSVEMLPGVVLWPLADDR